MTTTSSTLTRGVDQIVADVVAAELGLDAAHCLCGDQDWDIPPDAKLFVVVFDDDGPVIGEGSFLDVDPASPTFEKEVQTCAKMHRVRVEAMSLSDEAKARKEEIGLALTSQRAQQAMGQYGVSIGRPGQAVNASEAEVTRRLRRFVIAVNVTAVHRKVQAPPAGADFFDKFNGAQADGTALPPSVATEN